MSKSTNKQNRMTISDNINYLTSLFGKISINKNESRDNHSSTNLFTTTHVKTDRDVKSKKLQTQQLHKKHSIEQKSVPVFDKTYRSLEGGGNSSNKQVAHISKHRSEIFVEKIKKNTPLNGINESVKNAKNHNDKIINERIKSKKTNSNDIEKLTNTKASVKNKSVETFKSSIPVKSIEPFKSSEANKNGYETTNSLTKLNKENKKTESNTNKTNKLTNTFANQGKRKLVDRSSSNDINKITNTSFKHKKKRTEINDLLKGQEYILYLPPKRQIKKVIRYNDADETRRQKELRFQLKQKQYKKTKKSYTIMKNKK